MAIAGRDREPGPTESDLRQAFFAQAGELSIRYGVSFDRVLEHLDAARPGHPRAFAIAHLDDLMVAVACIDGNDLAWRDLVEEHERALVRACRQWLDPNDAIVFVRRLLADLRRGEPGVQSLRTFGGDVPVRRWLADRLMGRMNRWGADFDSSRKVETHRMPAIPLPEGHFIAGNVLWHQQTARPADDDRPARPSRQA